MIVNYIQNGYRTLAFHKSYFILNFLGLGLGICAAVLVATFVNYELSYDRYQPESENIYRVHTDFSAYGLGVLPVSNVAVSNEVKSINDIREVFVLSNAKVPNFAELNGRKFDLPNYYSATANIKNFIDLDVLHGDLAEVLSKPNQIALNKSQAIRFFGVTDAVGKTLTAGDKEVKVGAIFHDLPSNTHYDFEMLSRIEPSVMSSTNRVNTDSFVYIKTGKNVEVSELAERLSDVYGSGTFEGKLKIQLVPLRDIHLMPSTVMDMKPGGSKEAIYISSLLSVVIIFIAGFNFVNLTIAQSNKRAKEVGMRKALGASKLQIFLQFLTETLMITLSSLLFGLALAEVLLPWFSNLVGSPLAFGSQNWFIFSIVVLTLMLSVIAGCYPALFFANFSTRRILSGDISTGKTAIVVRKTLLVIQSAMAIGLITASVILILQVHYMESISPGYSYQNRVVVNVPREFAFSKNDTAFINQVKQIEGISNLSVIDSDLTKFASVTSSISWSKGATKIEKVSIIGTSYNITEGLGVELLAGRDFSDRYQSDWASTQESGGVRMSGMVTESLVKMAGFENNKAAIGERISLPGGEEITVVGVVRDVQIGSTRGEVSNVLFICGQTQSNRVAVTLVVEQTRLSAVVEKISELTKNVTNENEPKIWSLEDKYLQLTDSEKRITKVVVSFSVLSVLLTAFGMYGLATLSIQRRKKEVAIRRVLGASKLGIVTLVAKEYLLMVIVSALLILPPTFYVLNDWLKEFNYRIEQPIWGYLLPYLIVSVITWLTVASITYRAASIHPSTVLKNE
ncbi:MULTISPECIES: ABC transporter permease [Idiomarina]|uniref:ABC transporter permease n=1 Tax=Idiomarina TaxID=135575 RepID=UPI0003121804|nr:MULTISPECIES: ABC transporter permease [unclassified Idiomarina]NWO03279.1 ABC transporter permease [Idiomarinaceae bacterium]|tara:strand:- start:1515 stop:3902 length:2388 start_codon:yes stop_codon:yes gene_type:complete